MNGKSMIKPSVAIAGKQTTTLSRRLVSSHHRHVAIGGVNIASITNSNNNYCEVNTGGNRRHRHHHHHHDGIGLLPQEMTSAMQSSLSSSSSWRSSSSSNNNNNPGRRSFFTWNFNADDNFSETTTTTESNEETITEEYRVAMEEKTRTLLGAKLSVDDPEVWNDAEQVLKYWSQQYSNSDSNNTNNNNNEKKNDNKSKNNSNNRHDPVNYCIRILDRLSDILPKNERLFGSMLDTQLLNAILYRWQNSIHQRHRQHQEQKYYYNQQQQLEPHSSNNNNNSNHHHPQTRTQTKRNQQKQQPYQQLLTPSTITEKIEKYRWSSLVQPDAHTYHFVLNTASLYQTEANGAPFAEALMETLIKVSETLSSENYLVDKISFGLLIKACAQQRRPQQAEDWLRKMQDLYQQNKESSYYNNNDDSWQSLLQPNAVIYTTVIDGWARVGNGPRAQAILDEQLEDCLVRENMAAQPDATTFNAVLNAWAKTERINNNNNNNNSNHNDPSSPSSSSRKEKKEKQVGEAQLQTQKIVAQMQEYSSNLGWHCAPDKYTYASAISCCAAHESPERAERLLHELEGMASERELSGSRPSIVSYNAVLSAYSQEAKAQKAQLLLERLLMVSSPVDPDRTSFNTVIAAWAKASKKQPDAPLRIQTLMTIMEEDWGIHPNVVAYGSLINSWANSKRPDAAENAERVLREMQASSNNEHRNGTSIKPNIVCYNAVLKAWANASANSRSTQPLARLTAIFDELVQQQQQQENEAPVVKPTLVTFRTMLHAVAASNAHNKLERAQVVMALMERFQIQPTADEHKILNRLLSKKKKTAIKK